MKKLAFAPAVGQILDLVCPACHLLVMTVTAGRFESGLTLHSHHCASCTVIYGRIIGCRAAYLQVSKAFGIIPGEVNLPFSETAWNMKLLFSSVDETHSSPVPRTCKWAQGLCLIVSGTPSLNQASPRHNHVHCTLYIWKYRLTWSGKCHRYSLFLPLLSTHTLGISCSP
jgi:hypothetical protein